MSLSDATTTVDADGQPSIETFGLESGEGGYAVKLPVFEGPLDLLLHLIRQNEMDIADIPIALIATQYLAYIELMKELNIDVAGEYLVMAATLALIKSRMLLPSEAEDDQGEEVDPRTELILRLLEYQRFKEAAETLSHRRLLGRDIFEAQAPRPEGTPESEREIEVGLFELIEAFREMLEDARKYDPHSVETENVTVRERMTYVMDQFVRGENLEFHRIFEGGEGVRPSRPMLVATFLAILELARLGAVQLYQSVDDTGTPEGSIHLRALPEPSDGLSWHERITDTM